MHLAALTARCTHGEAWTMDRTTTVHSPARISPTEWSWSSTSCKLGRRHVRAGGHHVAGDDVHALAIYSMSLTVADNLGAFWPV
jgi:hypothetical protein